MKIKETTVNKILILFISFLLLFMAFQATANNVTLDPTISTQDRLTVTCEYPIEREDGTPLAVNEIAQVNFFVEKDGVGGYVPAGENTTACRQVYDMTSVPDGVYVYAVTAVDTEGRESLYSSEVVTATVKRLPNPSTPTGVTGLVD